MITAQGLVRGNQNILWIVRLQGLALYLPQKGQINIALIIFLLSRIGNCYFPIFLMSPKSFVYKS